MKVPVPWQADWPLALTCWLQLGLTGVPEGLGGRQKTCSSECTVQPAFSDNPSTPYNHPENQIKCPDLRPWVAVLSHDCHLCFREADADYESSTSFGWYDLNPSATCVLCTGNGGNNGSYMLNPWPPEGGGSTEHWIQVGLPRVCVEEDGDSEAPVPFAYCLEVE